jgi:hypothetical protein
MFSEPKTAHGRRSVALDPYAVRVLREHRKRQAREQFAWGAPYRASALVFTREDGSPIHPDRFSNVFDAHAKAAGLPRIRLHDLRHNHATVELSAILQRDRFPHLGAKALVRPVHRWSRHHRLTLVDPPGCGVDSASESHVLLDIDCRRPLLPIGSADRRRRRRDLHFLRRAGEIRTPDLLTPSQAR